MQASTSSTNAVPQAGVATGGAPHRGRVLGEFTVGEQIGHGAFSVVYQGEQTRIGRQVAIKILVAHALESDRNAFLREALLASRLDHPFAAHVYGGGTEPDGTVWIAMELVQGSSLAQLLEEQQRLSLEQFVPLCERVCEVVQAAHEQGIIHRDLKPSNIVVHARAGQLLPKLLDFGVAKAEGDLLSAVQAEPTATQSVGDQADQSNPDSTLSIMQTAQGAAVGSPGYMAPEQWSDSSTVDRRCDVYALGVVCYESLTGSRPFAGKTREELARAHTSASVPPVGKGLPRELDAFFQRALAKAPADRFASALELATGLRAASQLDSRARRSSRARSLRLAAAALIALVLCAEGWRRTLPFGERTLAIEVENLSGPEAGWASPIVQRLAEKALGDDRHFAIAHRPDEANSILHLDYRLAPDGVELAPAVGRKHGHLAQLPSSRGVSIAAALSAATNGIAALVGNGRPARGPSSEETAEMSRHGARDLTELLLYRRLMAESGGSGGDSDAAEIELKKLVAADPGWGHAAALLAVVEDLGSPPSQKTLADGQANADRARDPNGGKILDGFALLMKGDVKGAVAMLEPIFRADKSEYLLGYYLAMGLSRLSRASERDAVLRDLWKGAPEMQFGMELASALRTGGHGDEADEIARTWVDLAPASETAQSVRAGFDVNARRYDEAERRLRRMLIVFGPAPSRELKLCDALIFAGRLTEARSIAEKLLLGDDSDKGQADYRISAIDILEGKFSAAQAALEADAALASKMGMAGNLFEVLDSLRTLSALNGDQAALTRWDEQLAEGWVSTGRGGRAVITRYEHALRSAPPCPDLETAIAVAPAGHARDLLRRLGLRSAAMAGCATCAEVVRAGLDASESTAHSVSDFATCALREKQFQLAFDGLKLVQTPILSDLDRAVISPSPFHTVLGHYLRGRALEGLNDPAAAKREYQVFLAAWDHADRPIAEVAEARGALARLP